MPKPWLNLSIISAYEVEKYRVPGSWSCKLVQLLSSPFATPATMTSAAVGEQCRNRPPVKQPCHRTTSHTVESSSLPVARPGKR